MDAGRKWFEREKWTKGDSAGHTKWLGRARNGEGVLRLKSRSVRRRSEMERLLSSGDPSSLRVIISQAANEPLVQYETSMISYATESDSLGSSWRRLVELN